MDGESSICPACGRAIEAGTSYCLACGTRIATVPQSRLVRGLRRLLAFVPVGQPFARDPAKSLRVYRHSPLYHY